MIMEKLRRPFEEEEIEWRVQQSGEKNGKVWAVVLAYVTNRAIMDRLDEVFGVGGWKNEFLPTPSMDGVMCGISVKIGDEWVTKYDGAENTQVEAVKGGLSSAMKRTAVQFGIGRYLYKLESNFAQIITGREPGSKRAKTKQGTWFYWLPPELPKFALPITHNQIKEIKERIEKKDVNVIKMLEYFKIKDIHNASKELGLEIIKLLDKKEDKPDENNSN